MDDASPPIPSRAEILAPYGLVLIAIAFNLFVLRAEAHPAQPPNDFSVHISLVRWAERRLSQGGLGFDGWYPRIQLGVAPFHHYQSLAPVVGGLIATVFGAARTVAWTNYLLVSTLPLSIYWATRLFGFRRWIASITALVSPLVSSITLYGYEHGSFQWRGNGIWTALWGIWLLPLTLGFMWRAVSRGKGYALAALLLGLTIAAHILTAYLAFLALGIWVVIAPKEILRRAGRAAVVAVGGALVGAWALVPLLADDKWSARTEYNVGTFWSDSYGGRKVIGWLVQGELFDYGRWPVVSILAAVGLLVCIWRFRRDERARAIVAFSGLSLALFCGRGAFGFIIDRLPGSRDLLLHRYIVGVHLGGIILAGIGSAWMVEQAYLTIVRRRGRVPKPAVVAGILALGIIALAPAWRERARYDNYNAQGINLQRAVDNTDGKDFTALADAAAARGGGRIYAGSPATRTSDNTIGSVPAYIYLLDDDVDAIGFTLRLVSLSSDVETRFNDADPAHYNLFNVKYSILPSGQAPSVRATFLQAAGRWRLWEIPTSGYLQVVDTTSAITADRTNLGRRTAAYLSSRMPAEGITPVIAFGGRAAAQPTDAAQRFTGSPGDVSAQYDMPDDGVFGGVVTANRNAVVMLKATYDPHWHVTVDGRPAETQMLAPSFVGVAVTPGEHRIEFRYAPFRYYWALFLIGALTVVALAVLPSRLGRIHERVRTFRR